MPRNSDDEILVTRRIHALVGRHRKTATLTLWKPFKQGKNWICKFHVSNTAMTEAALAYGVDGLQALTLALDGLRSKLDQTRYKWTWTIGGESAVPRLVPQGFGLALTKRIESYIDTEVGKFSKAAEGKARRAQRRVGGPRAD